MHDIVLCDDNKIFRDGLSLLIESQEDMRLVGKFHNCNGLLNALAGIKPHVILLDINIPGINGIDGLNLIKERNSTTKIIMLTVFDDDVSVFTSMQRGADGYLLKKSHPEKILEAIRDVLSGGAALTPSVAKQVLRLFTAKPSLPENYNLSVREREILHLVVAGYNYKEIADKLFISWETVRSHVKKIYEKLQVNSKVAAVNKFLSISKNR